MQFTLAATPTSSNLVRHPIDGHFYTCSGRLIPQPPWIIPGNDVTQSLYDQWLIDQGRDEASGIGGDWLILRLDGVDAEMITEDLRGLLSDYLFAQATPHFEARGTAFKR